MTYTVAVIGAGSISDKHLSAIGQMDQLRAVGIADVNQERAEAAARRYAIKAYTNYTQMIEFERPDIVVITLPHYLHMEAAIISAEAGCHILLEKPMALNEWECDKIGTAARKNGIRLMVGHTMQYLPANKKVYEMIRSGGLGELVMINDARHVHYYSPERPDWFLDRKKSGGGIWMNLGAHAIDRIQWLTGSGIRAVKSSLSYYGSKGDVEGSGAVLMTTAEGVSATVCLSGYEGVSRNDTEFIFSKRMLKIANGQLWISEKGTYEKVEVDESVSPFVLQFQDLLSSIEHQMDPPCSALYGRSVIRVIEAIYRSHREGREILIKV